MEADLKAKKKKSSWMTYKDGMRNNVRAWGIWWKLCPHVFVAGTCHAIFQAAFPYVSIWFSARIINELSGAGRRDVLWPLVLTQLVVTALLLAGKAFSGHWNDYERDRARWLGNQIWMKKMMQMDYADVDHQRTYDLYSQIRQNENWDSMGMWKTLEIFGQMSRAVLQIAGGIGLSASLFCRQVSEDAGWLTVLNHPACIVITGGVLLGTSLISAEAANRGGQYWKQAASEIKQINRVANFYGFFSQDRRRAADIRIYDQQEQVVNGYMDQGMKHGLCGVLEKLMKGPMGLWYALSQSISAVMTGLVYLFVCLKAWAGAFGVGSITQYVGAITAMLRGISELFQAFGMIGINSRFLQDGFALLDIPNQMYQGSLTTEKRSDGKYEVEFRDVSFRYPGTEEYALRHVNLTFDIGSSLAVVGPNGSGKTTFIKLLCRLYDPTEGEILLNGIDIRKYRYDEYMRIFAVVFQDFRLFAMSLGENVAGSTRYDDRKVQDCLAQAGLGERLSKMERGLATALYRDLDQDGVEISGGEAQKIAIARALYQDAPFLILDEPTAALDPRAEAEVYRKFHEMTKQRTTVYISHRLSSCRFCDRIAVFDGGSVVQMGDHEELKADPEGKYYELWNAQAKYYREEGESI